MIEQKPVLEELADVEKAIVDLTGSIDNHQLEKDESTRLKLRGYILQCDELLRKTSREGPSDNYQKVNTVCNATRGLLRLYFKDYVSREFIERPRTSRTN